MNFAIFDEAYYLLKYPWVKSAIEMGQFTSGLDHFQKVGMVQQKLTEVSPHFDESYYLANNPQIANAVQSGMIPSGLFYFIQSGYEEGQKNISPSYNEDYYLKRYPELVPFIQNGSFKSGLQHFLQWGQKEGRLATNFFEPEYLKNNPGVNLAVRQGIFKTGFDHYLKFGQFEPNRSATFMGTNDSDTVESFGSGKVEITGVPLRLDGSGKRIYERDINRYKNTGSVERDTLIGGTGKDEFILGSDSGSFYPWGPTTIVNLDPSQDIIRLGGLVSDYKQMTDQSNDLYITTSSKPGYEAIIKGGVNFSKNYPISQWIQASSNTTLDNFAESFYLKKNPDVASAVKAGMVNSGLEHYQQFGHLESSRQSAFFGTEGNDILTAFGVGKKDIIGVKTEYNNGSYHFLTDGKDEVDTLIGSEGIDRFILGDYYSSGRTFLPVPTTLYLGSGEAKIRNFNQSQGDEIQLLGKPEDYQISPQGNDLIIAKNGDTIARFEGSANLNLQVIKPPSPNYLVDVFILG